MIGPLDQAGVADLITRGEVSDSDLAQRDGVEVWVPVHRLIPRKTKPTRLHLALDRGREGGLRFWAALHLNPLRIGLACLLGGCVLIIFGHWTFLLFVPAFAAAVFAGATLLTRHRFVTGTFLSVSAVVLPAVFLLAGRDDGRLAHALPRMPLPSIEPVIAPPKPLAFPPKPPRVSLSGLALPQPVVPTPTPRPVPPI